MSKYYDLDQEKIILHERDRVTFYLKEHYTGINYTISEYIERGDSEKLNYFIDKYLYGECLFKTPKIEIPY
tara:strand:- start:71 stop:283 length:213 start_codon:yes stop_codon:yes gene_type:complete